MLLIFDWDGTLLDSTGKIVSCMQMAINELNLPFRDELQVKNIIGLGLPEAIGTLFPDIDEECCLNMMAAYSRSFREADQTPCNFYPGVQQVLEYLKTEGHQLAVATGKSRKGLNRVLHNLQLTEFFDGSRCADETASKPDPLMLMQLMSEFSVEPRDAVMVGDTEFDLGMANNAGIKSVAVSYGAHSKERLLKHEPELIIDSFEQLLQVEGL
jgi:phosphoglycolate phosphatase